MERAPLHTELARVPDGGAAYWVCAEDGVRLRVGVWGGGPECTGTVFLFPGRTQYMELHGPTIESLRRFGYGTLVLDWRGHGLSDRVTVDSNTIHVGRFSDYQQDVAALVRMAKTLEVPRPWFLVGTSMGGCVGLRALAEGLSVAACAFTGPMWGIKLKHVERIAAWALSCGAQASGRGHVYCPGHDGKNYALANPFAGNRITNDADMYQFWRDQAQAHPELQMGGSSMGWLYQGLLECRRLSKIPAPDTPCITFCGDEDTMVDLGAIQHRMERWPNGQFELIQNAKHELLLEAPRIRQRLLTKISAVFARSGF
ncbi:MULTISPECIES: alpha/beta hydrolase [Mameliella]|uniref:Lysophospholipase n=1 Tax=Mameliella alba TaxID=561184 RepID=A0A0B3RQD3_9RHOB|nr:MULTISPECIES: alpha/beta hydrolase [Mameliella]KHQ50057.1 Lysophospholipase [Mameliella alba]